MQDFIDGYFSESDKSRDRISKSDMELHFKKAYPDKHLSMVQIITSLKDKVLNYNPSMRINGVQGCFTHLKLKVKKLVGKGVQQNHITDYMIQLENKLDDAKVEIESLQQPLLEAQQTKPSMNKKVKKVTYEYESDDESGPIPPIFKKNVFIEDTRFTQDDIDDIIPRLFWVKFFLYCW